MLTWPTIVGMTTDRKRFRTGRHVVYALHAHIVLVTKYRRGAITPEVQKTIEEAAREVAARLDFTITEMDGENDHFHLLVTYPPPRNWRYRTW